jgi:tRNA-specific adenosine deaminase 3
MALVHSRVHRIFFKYSMPKTGGCGGCVAVIGLEGINHRYDVYQWKGEAKDSAQSTSTIKDEYLNVGEDIDA